MSRDKTVRLIDEAHALLAEKAKDHNVSMKEVASEAISLFANSIWNKDKDCIAQTEQLKAKLKRLQEILIFYVLLIGSAACILGVLLGVRL